MEKKKEWKKWIFWFSFAVASIFVYKTLDNFTNILDWIGNLINLLMPFILAIIIAYLFYIPAKSIEETYRKSSIKFLNKVARGLSVITVYIIALMVIVIVVNFVLPTISASVKDLANNLPTYYNSLRNFISDLPEDSVLAKLNLKDSISKLEDINILQIFSLDNVNKYIEGAVGLVNVIFDIFVTIVVSVYILLERGEIKEFVSKLAKAMFNKKTYDDLAKYFEKTNTIFFNFISSQFIDAIIVGVITSIAMSLMNVKYAVLLGFMIGLFNIIPYFGAIVAVVLAIIITIFTGGITQALWLAIIVVILQQIDANIINPRILGNSLHISPILVIFSVSVGGAYFGVLGMFLAVPIVSMIKILIFDYIEKKEEIVVK